MPDVFATNNFTIRELIDANYKFKIPKLQRGFVWTERETKQLLNSIDKHIDLNIDMYLGTMLFYKKGSSDTQIVDGQQRITTITIFIQTVCLFLENLKIFFN